MGVRYQNRVLSKYLCLCTCNYPFYGAYMSLIHRPFKLSTDIWGKCGTTMCYNEFVRFNLQYDRKNYFIR